MAFKGDYCSYVLADDIPNPFTCWVHPTIMGFDGDIGAFTHMDGWAVNANFAASSLSPSRAAL